MVRIYLRKDRCGTYRGHILCTRDLVRIFRRRLIFNLKALTRILKSQCPSMFITSMSCTCPIYFSNEFSKVSVLVCLLYKVIVEDF